MYNRIMLSQKKLLTLIIILVFVVIGAILFINFSSKNNNSSLFPTPTPVSGKTPPNGSSGAFGPKTPAEIEQSRKSGAVYALIPQIPIMGRNFSLYYSFSSDLFILYINPSQKDAGEKEFDDFLKKNGIDSRSWIERLFVTYISPTPIPPSSAPTTPVTPAP